MSALQVLIDGFLTAAELVALLFVSPVSAMDQPRTERGPGAPAIERARDTHLLSSSFDVRLLGSLADVRVSQYYRNSGAEPINLAGRLPSVDEQAVARVVADWTTALFVRRDIAELSMLGHPHRLDA